MSQPETAARRLTSGAADGYFCIDEAGRPLVQGITTRERTEIWIGCDAPVVIEKMFGPLVFMGLRVRADFESCEWIIERECGPEGEWREVARVPGQLEEDFAGV